MIRLVGSELFKLRTTRTFYGIVGGSLGLVLVIVILVTALVNFSPSDHPLSDTMNFAAFVQPFVLVLGLVTSVLIFLIVKGIGGARDLDTSGDGGKVIIGTTVGTALWGALGLGVGSILRNQVGAIVGSLVYLFVLENLLQIIPGLDDIIQKYGFGVASNCGVTTITGAFRTGA